MYQSSEKLYHIAIAKSPEELASVYRLRYDVFFEEGRDERYADHDLKHWSDEDDCPDATVVAVWTTDGEAVATIRVTCLKHRDFIGHSVFRFDLLADIVNLSEEKLRNRVAKADRGAVRAGHRGKGLVQLCQDMIEKVALSHGCDILVGVPGIGNSRSRRAFEKVGWKEYPVQATFRGFTGQLIYKKLALVS
jgi:hypothetical protein